MLMEACPKGIDVYFDNVGGEALESALLLLRQQARVVLCGGISQYNPQGAADVVGSFGKSRTESVDGQIVCRAKLQRETKGQQLKGKIVSALFHAFFPQDFLLKSSLFLRE